MIKVDLHTEDIAKDLKNKLPNILRRTVKQLAYESQQEIREELPNWLNLNKEWLKRGIRFSTRGNEAVIYSKDKQLEKHEKGLKINGNLLVPTPLLRAQGMKKKWWPKNILSQKGFFKDSRGIFKRGKGGSLVMWYSRTKGHDFNQKTEMEDTAQGVVDDRAQEIFNKIAHEYS